MCNRYSWFTFNVFVSGRSASFITEQYFLLLDWTICHPWHRLLNVFSTSLVKWMSHVLYVNVLKILETFICWTKMYQTIHKHDGCAIHNSRPASKTRFNFTSVAYVATVQLKGYFEHQTEILHHHLSSTYLTPDASRSWGPSVTCCICASKFTLGSAVCITECLYCHDMRKQECKTIKEYNYNIIIMLHTYILGKYTLWYLTCISYNASVATFSRCWYFIYVIIISLTLLCFVAQDTFCDVKLNSGTELVHKMQHNDVRYL